MTIITRWFDVSVCGARSEPRASQELNHVALFAGPQLLTRRSRLAAQYVEGVSSVAAAITVAVAANLRLARARRRRFRDARIRFDKGARAGAAVDFVAAVLRAGHGRHLDVVADLLAPHDGAQADGCMRSIRCKQEFKKKHLSI